MWLLLPKTSVGGRKAERIFFACVAQGKFTHDEARSYVCNPHGRKMEMMPAGLSVALALSAQAAATAPSAAYGPAPAATSAPAPQQPRQASDDCRTPALPDPQSGDIVVCAVRPNGYRIDPDVLAAKRMKKKGESVRPRNPHETYADHSCATVGPMGCRGQVTVDAFTAAAVVAEMGARLAKGQPIGPMFKTRPTESEYQLYLDAKKEREEEEAAKAAKAKAAAAQAAAGGAQTHN
jgi:hypothetical protein